MKLIFWISSLFIFHTFIGDPISLLLINKFFKKDKLIIDKNYIPKVSIIIPAHNEEKVIKTKLENLCSLNYPKSKYEIIIASDNSTDNTNNIVSSFINKLRDIDMRLYKVNERKGKTNAQNEAVKISRGEIIIFSDANSILDKEALRELVSYFNNKDISYVAGRLVYINEFSSDSSQAENSYWNYDLMMRECESNISSITAGNGAIYAVRKEDYIDIDPIYCHDSMFPIKFATMGKKSKYSKKALAFEKAGETVEDEFKRKVRMARKNLAMCYSDMKKYNPFKCGWFSYFYFSHRYLRNSLWIFHTLIFISNLFLINSSKFYLLVFIGQVVFYLLAIWGVKLNNKIIYLFYYYSITILAQARGAINELSGKSKPFWEKAESTR